MEYICVAHLPTCLKTLCYLIITIILVIGDIGKSDNGEISCEVDKPFFKFS